MKHIVQSDRRTRMASRWILTMQTVIQDVPTSSDPMDHSVESRKRGFAVVSSSKSFFDSHDPATPGRPRACGERPRMTQPPKQPVREVSGV